MGLIRLPSRGRRLRLPYVNSPPTEYQVQLGERRLTPQREPLYKYTRHFDIICTFICVTSLRHVKRHTGSGKGRQSGTSAVRDNRYNNDTQTFLKIMETGPVLTNRVAFTRYDHFHKKHSEASARLRDTNSYVSTRYTVTAGCKM